MLSMRLVIGHAWSDGKTLTIRRLMFRVGGVLFLPPRFGGGSETERILKFVLLSLSSLLFFLSINLRIHYIRIVSLAFVCRNSSLYKTGTWITVRGGEGRIIHRSIDRQHHWFQTPHTSQPKCHFGRRQPSIPPWWRAR